MNNFIIAVFIYYYSLVVLCVSHSGRYAGFNGAVFLTLLFFLFCFAGYAVIKIKHTAYSSLKFFEASTVFIKCMFVFSLFIAHLTILKANGNIQIIPIIFYFCSMLFYLFCVKNRIFNNNYGDLRTPLKKIDIKHFVLWTLLIVFIFIPFLIGIMYNNALIKKRTTGINRNFLEAKSVTSKNAIEDNSEFKTKTPLTTIFVLIFLASAVFLLRKYFHNHSSENNILKEDIEKELHSQGFTQDVKEEKKTKYYFPKDNNGEILKIYDRILSTIEKKIKSNFDTITPVERKINISKQIPEISEMFEGLTEIFIKARYSGDNITTEEILRSEDYAASIEKKMGNV